MKRFHHIVLLATAAAVRSAIADVTHEFGVSSCQPGTCTLIVDRPGVVHNEFPIVIPNDMTAQQKRDFIAAELGRVFVVTTAGTNRFSVSSATDETIVSFSTDDTQESDRITGPDVVSGAIAFAGHFFPFTPNNQPAVFSAGIVTDVGTFTVQISAAELNFQPDGPIICQALFERLGPRVAQYGAQINYAGDRLEVYFDPAYTVSQGGILFGTNSPSAGCSGAVRSVPPPAPPCPGDVDGDGDVDLSDLSTLLAHFGVTTGATRADGDLDADGDVDLSDLSSLLARFGTSCGESDPGD